MSRSVRCLLRELPQTPRHPPLWLHCIVRKGSILFKDEVVVFSTALHPRLLHCVHRMYGERGIILPVALWRGSIASHRSCLRWYRQLSKLLETFLSLHLKQANHEIITNDHSVLELLSPTKTLITKIEMSWIGAWGHLIVHSTMADWSSLFFVVA